MGVSRDVIFDGLVFKMSGRWRFLKKGESFMWMEVQAR